MLEVVGLSTFSLINGKINYSASVAPTTSNDNTEGYRVGSMWIDTTNDDVYRCTDDSTGMAVWIGTTLEVSDLGTLALKNEVTDVELNSTKLNGIEVGATADQTKSDIDALNIDASTVNNLTVLTNVPSGALFTDTIYNHPATHSIAEVSGLQTSLDGKVDDSQVLTNVPSGALFTDTVYSKPASEPISYVSGLQSALDGKTTEGYVDTQITNLVGSAPANLNTLQELGDALSDDANFASTVTTSLAGKVDKVTGKVLSTNDYTTTEKNKLSGIETGATADQTKADIEALGVNAPSLDAYNNTSAITGNAVDIFIYDTSKDSDGGAWRKRTQSTSWYNETLNTVTRGSRKDFPSVAVIVTESNKVTIYDGDDSDMPMWMVFDGGDRADMIYGLFDNSQKATKMLNGLLVSVGNDSGGQGGTFPISFIADNGYFLSDASNSPYKYIGNIEQRNDGLNVTAGESGNYGVTVSRYVNDVAMTVLPNAPIDSATGLPVPTIAVATNGGVSVIKDDGSVVNKTTTQLTSSTLNSSYRHKNIDIDGENLVVNYEYIGGGGYGQLMVITLSNLTVLRRYGRDYTNTSSSHPYFSSGTTHRHFPKQIYKNNNIFTREQNNSALNANADGILTIYENSSSVADGLINRITSDYNTGWMNGDIRGAWNVDTDVTSLGSELITNGDFASGTGWSAGGNWSISSGVAQITSGTGASFLQQAVSPAVLEAGKQYAVTATVTTTSGSLQPRIANSSYGSSFPDGTSTQVIVAGSTTTETILFYANSWIGTIDNVSVKEAIPDRSVKGNGLAVHGTPTVSAVATGAELKCISGFSASNYLEQPYNADLDFGTGDFCVMGWINPATQAAHHGIVNRMDSGGGAGFLLEHRIGGTLLLQSDDGTTVSNLFSTSVSLNAWSQFCCTVTNSGTSLEWFINGVSVATATVTARNVTNTAAVCRIGEKVTQSRPMDGSLALIRISATAPTAEQIAKIYEDEKVLFQENAKCTLNGSSNVVQALAYDDSTELLHVGTSGGRSSFSGLVRVDETSTNTTEISAQGGMIVEETS